MCPGGMCLGGCVQEGGVQGCLGGGGVVCPGDVCLEDVSRGMYPGVCVQVCVSRWGVSGCVYRGVYPGNCVSRGGVSRGCVSLGVQGVCVQVGCVRGCVSGGCVSRGCVSRGGMSTECVSGDVQGCVYRWDVCLDVCVWGVSRGCVQVECVSRVYMSRGVCVQEVVCPGGRVSKGCVPPQTQRYTLPLTHRVQRISHPL